MKWRLFVLCFLISLSLLAGCNPPAPSTTNNKQPAATAITKSKQPTATATKGPDTTQRPMVIHPTLVPTLLNTPPMVIEDRPASTAVVSCLKITNLPVYEVELGDTLSSIAEKTATTPEALMDANCLTNDRLEIGDILYIPLIQRPTLEITLPRF
jgi:LysM repeat protein